MRNTGKEQLCGIVTDRELIFDGHIKRSVKLLREGATNFVRKHQK